LTHRHSAHENKIVPANPIKDSHRASSPKWLMPLNTCGFWPTSTPKKNNNAHINTVTALLTKASRRPLNRNPTAIPHSIIATIFSIDGYKDKEKSLPLRRMFSKNTMMIKKLIFVVAMTTMLCACSKANRVEENSLDTASVVSRVNDIYNDVFKRYIEFNQKPSDMPLVNNDSLYCSADWNRQIARVDSVNQQNGVIDILDVDYWIMGQDWDKLSVSDVHVVSMTDSTATVELNLHNLGNVTPVRLDMIFENDAWRIDNFIDVKNNYDWKARMQEYLTQEKGK
jgi:hypothetical protein